MNTLMRILATAVATFVAAWLVPGITVAGRDTTQTILTLLAVSVIIGVVNAIVKPVVQFATGCLIVLTFGLFLLVVNALMLMFSAWLAGLIGLGFAVEGFWPALFGSIVISIVSGIVYAVLPTKAEQG